MTTMGTHIFPFGPQAIQQGQGKIRACYFCAAIEGATRSVTLVGEGRRAVEAVAWW